MLEMYGEGVSSKCIHEHLGNPATSPKPDISHAVIGLSESAKSDITIEATTAALTTTNSTLATLSSRTARRCPPLGH